ncbi:MAG: hypothetical protein P8Y36_05000 [Alphaproteobacteria bacterium]
MTDTSKPEDNAQMRMPNIASGANGRCPVGGTSESISTTTRKQPDNARRRQHLRGKLNAPVYGALDLGTNNCRLLVARPSRRGFQVIDAFSRIIRLGEGLSNTGMLSDDAMARTLDALKICSDKMERREVHR